MNFVLYAKRALRDELPVHGPGRREGGDGNPAGAGTDI